MSNPPAAILEGMTIAARHWELVLGILLILTVSGFILRFTLRRIFSDRISGEEYHSLTLGGWLLPAALMSLLWYAGSQIISQQASMIVTIVLVAGLILLIRTPKTKSNMSKPILVSLLSLAVLFVILRLAFVSKAVLPLYFDSSLHYLWTKQILGNTIQSLANYYHLGFHFLAAFVTFLTGAQINETLLVLGQIILAIMPFPVFFLIRHWTGSNAAGIFGVLVAGFGWYMPAHAMDWGKYPALTSLALLPFVLSLACLSVQNKNSLSARSYWSLNAIVLAGMFVCIFLHSRALIVFIIAALTWAITLLWQKLPKFPGLLVLGLMMAALVYEIVFIQTGGILGPLFDPYGPKGIWITSAVLLLSIFAYQTNPRLVFFCVVSIVFLIAGLFVPIGAAIPGYINLTLLDRPFVEMILYLPLSVLGGFGLARLEQILGSRKISLGTMQFASSKAIVVFFVALVVVNAWFEYDLYPSDCCDIVSHDDLEAIDWMDRNLPPDARILISSTSLNVLPTTADQGTTGGDAGTWITPLIDRAIIFMPFNTDFSQQQTLDIICQQQADYVYVGKTGWGFNDTGMAVFPDGYKTVFSVPNAKVYEVTGCG